MIQLEKIKRIYKSGNYQIQALKGIDLKIPKGEMIVLFGPSGSGKSTLLNILGAMDTPSEGKYIFEGENISVYSPRKLVKFRAGKIGFIFQNFNLVPTLNVFENIVIPMKLKSMSYKKDQIWDLIEKVGLKEHISHRPDELSGGQRQRVAIARALAHKPPFVLADEPTANLDSKTACTIIDLLKDLNQQEKTTMVIASHDRWVLDNIPNKIALRDGLLEYSL